MPSPDQHAYRKVTQSFKGYFLSMRGTTKTGKIVIGHIEHFVEIFRTNKVVVRNNAFDGRDDEFLFEPGLQFAQVIL